MRNKLGYVALTYYSPKRLLFAVVFGLAYVGMAVGFRSQSSSPSPPVDMRLWCLGWFAFMFGIFLVGQAKWQFANPRARIIPGYRTPHLLLLAILLFVVVTGIPWLVVLGTEVNVWGALAYSAALVAPMVWASQTNQGFPWSLLSLGIFFSSFTSAASAFWLAPDVTPVEIHFSIFVVAWLGLAYWLFRVATLREDNPEYEFYAITGYDRRSRGERAEQRRMIASLLAKQPLTARVADWWHDRLQKRAAPVSGPSYALFRYGFRPTPLAIAFFNLLIVLPPVIYLLSNWTGWLADVDKSLNWGAMVMPLWMVIVLPAMSASEALAGRRPRMAAEILWPLSRERFCQAMLFSCLQDSFILWCAFNVAFGAAAWYLGFYPPSGELVITYLCLGASLNFLGSGLAMHTAICESRITRILCQTAIGGGMIAVLAAWWTTRESTGDGLFIAVSLAIAALACPAMLSARRAWSQAELG